MSTPCISTHIAHVPLHVLVIRFLNVILVVFGVEGVEGKEGPIKSAIRSTLHAIAGNCPVRHGETKQTCYSIFRTWLLSFGRSKVLGPVQKPEGL